MKNRISTWQDDFGRREEHSEGPQPVGEILAELLARYRVHFPEAKIAILETPAAA